MQGHDLVKQYFTLCGWSDFQWMPLSEVWMAANPQGKHVDVPKLDSNANLALAEAQKVFQQWSAGNGTGDDAEDQVIFSGWPEKDLLHHKDGYGYGEYAFCEAILKALIAAKEVE